jgi:hypothetical protein
MYSVIGCPRDSVKQYFVSFYTSVSPVFRAKLPKIPPNSLLQIGQNFADCQDFFMNRILYISNAAHFQALVVQTHPGAAQTRFLLTPPGAAQASKV